MNYPFWVVPIIGSGWVIGIVAIIHILISHFAVGGGFYLVLAERRAIKLGRSDWLEYIKKHSKFFLLLTVVAGAMTGVGIWFSIGLTSPEATSSLIHNFVLGWAAEWTFFLAEIAAILVYYHTWNKVSQKVHMAIGWIYAVAAWMSLFIINGILTFMLYPGKAWLATAGTGREASAFWPALFNPGYFPSLVFRTLICLSLAGIFALITASRLNPKKQGALKEDVVKWSAKWLMPSFLLLPFAAAWYFHSMPPANRSLFKRGISTIGQGIFTQITREAVYLVAASFIVFVLVYFLAWKQPKAITTGQTLIILVLAFSILGAAEHIREMARKPYVIGGYMYANGTRVSERENFNKNGYLTDTIWATEAEKQDWASIDKKAEDASHETAAATAFSDAETLDREFAGDTVTRGKILRRGELMFRGQCMACHTLNGYRSIHKLLRNRDEAAIESMMKLLYEYKADSIYRAFMPPLVGTKGEISALVEFLESITKR
jgi:cytochrome d ubiquinol oxidase subunit I